MWKFLMAGDTEEDQEPAGLQPKLCWTLYSEMFASHYPWLNTSFFPSSLMYCKHWKPFLNRQYLYCARSLFNGRICQKSQNSSEHRRQMTFLGVCVGGVGLHIADKCWWILTVIYPMCLLQIGVSSHLFTWGMFLTEKKKWKRCRYPVF